MNRGSEEGDRKHCKKCPPYLASYTFLCRNTYFNLGEGRIPPVFSVVLLSFKCLSYKTSLNIPRQIYLKKYT